MRLWRYFAVLLLASSLVAGQVVDRIVAVVNRQVILESQLEQSIQIQFLLEGKPLERITPADQQVVLDQLIDRALLAQQIVTHSMLDPSPDEVAGRVREIRSQIPGATSDEQWQAMLSRYGISQHDLEMQIIEQLRVLRFVDLRFRALAHADRTAVAAYYQEKFLPELRKRGSPEPPLNQVSGEIEKILTEQRIDELLNGWLQALRSQAQIRKLPIESGVATGATP